MGEPIKIVKVSYGNFSCTLEGYDDPFDMMTAITDYFRDLTASDRCFGAVPMPPDEKTPTGSADHQISDRSEDRAPDGQQIAVPSDPTVTASKTDVFQGATDHTETAADPMPDAAWSTPSDFDVPDLHPEMDEPVATSHTFTDNLALIRSVVGSDSANVTDEIQSASKPQAPLPPETDISPTSRNLSETASEKIGDTPEESPTLEDTSANIEATGPAEPDSEAAAFDSTLESEALALDETDDRIQTVLRAPMRDHWSSTSLRAPVVDDTSDLFAATLETRAAEDDTTPDSPTDITLADTTPTDATTSEGSQTDDDNAPAKQSDAKEGSAARRPLPSTSEDEMSRLTAKADEKLASPEANRRRNAIAHLKAAVAATEAARQLGEAAKTPDDDEGVFRDDLAQAVRPRRARAENPGRERPAPVKLIASQPFDADPSDLASPVQPRRVPNEQPAIAPRSFSDYAASVGATSLQDLLEAAAAYSVTVEEADDFSRPQILKMVEAIAEKPFTREDGLRAFGTLLRQGQIIKADNGRFKISEQTRFHPKAQAATA